MKSLVGYTGFVGSNIAKNAAFDGLYNSKNINEAYGTNPDLLVYCGVPAAKFLANKNPKEDLAVIENAINNIKLINPKKIVLISTVDVYKTPVNVDEDSEMDVENLHPYGANRLVLENWVRSNYNDYLIVRLPALYGDNLKKNFIFDMITIIPTLLKNEKYSELSSKSELIKNSYYEYDKDFYHVKDNIDDTNALKQELMNVGFTSLNFTDSRAMYQFYNLDNLWNHIQIALDNNIRVLNIATEPVSANEVYEKVYNKPFDNQLNNTVPNYNYKTKYYKVFSGKKGYIFDKQYVLNDIEQFVDNKIK